MIIERVVEKMYKILVVDDAGFMRMMIKTCLTKSGYPNVIEGEDGEKAIALYKAEKPDLVFMDITMPNLDGIGALKGIKEVDPMLRLLCALQWVRKQWLWKQLKRAQWTLL